MSIYSSEPYFTLKGKRKIGGKHRNSNKKTIRRINKKRKTKRRY